MKKPLTASGQLLKREQEENGKRRGEERTGDKRLS